MNIRNNSYVAQTVLTCFLLLFINSTGKGSTLIDNFESPTSPAPWKFYNGQEYPGATGSLALGTGYSGHGAHLAYDFSKGGRYVEAYLPLPAPITSPATISFWVKSPTTILVLFRILDSAGQTFQYNLIRPLSAVSATAWYQQMVELDRPSRFYGGVADGVIHYPITRIEILAGFSTVPAAAGAIDFDDVYLLPTSTLIDNFESSSSPAPWIFRNGGQTPSATGSLTLGTGHVGHGAHLAYDFSQGGSAVEALLPLPTPIPSAAAISFWVKSPPNIRVQLRVLDSTGQSLAYMLSRPLAASDVTAWYQQTVELDSPASYYGGAANGVIHFPITQIVIIAGNPIVPGIVGAIDFDDVYAVSSTQFDLDPAAALVPAPPGSGNLLSRMGVNIAFTSDDRALAIAQAAGFSWVRADLDWDGVETTPNVYDWSAYDQLISSLQSRGMKALFILDYGNTNYTGDPMLPPITTDQITAFGNFAQAAAQHFAGTGARFEVWNEPDIAGFWGSSPNPAQYSALASTAISRIHQGDPAAVVTTGGTANFNESYTNSFLKTGGGNGANAIGVHPYNIQNPSQDFMDHLVALRSLVSQYLSPAPPIWDTEWGFSSTDYSPDGNGAEPTARFIQSTKVAERILASCAVGSPIYIYYDLGDDDADPTDRYGNFGLIANDYSTKPALVAVQALAAVARNRTFVGMVPTAPSNLVAMRFDGATDRVYAMWNYAPTSTVTVTLPTNATVTDLYGSPMTLQKVGGRLAMTVEEGAGPVYIRIPNS